VGESGEASVPGQTGRPAQQHGRPVASELAHASIESTFTQSGAGVKGRCPSMAEFLRRTGTQRRGPGGGDPFTAQFDPYKADIPTPFGRPGDRNCSLGDRRGDLGHAHRAPASHAQRGEEGSALGPLSRAVSMARGNAMRKTYGTLMDGMANQGAEDDWAGSEEEAKLAAVVSDLKAKNETMRARVREAER